MKITYIVGIFPKLSETFVLSQITDLIDMGHEVEIISATKPTEEVVHEDVHNYSLMKKTHYLVRNQSSLGFELNEKLVSALFFTDLIHAHFAELPTEFALKISRAFGIPFVFTAHAYDIFINPDKSFHREKFDGAAKVITISDFNRNYLLNMLGEDLKDKIQVIRCGVRLENFPYIERQPEDSTRILLVGRFVEKKGIRYAVEAFNDVVRGHPNAELRIIGDGELKDEITSLIENLQIQEKVVLLGPQPQHEVIREMGEADIFLLPSVTASNGDREGAPVTIMEAAATGLPVVSTIHSGIPEVVIDGETGFLVPEKDTAALAQRLQELIQDPVLRNRMGKQGRLHIEKLYSHNAEMKKLESTFKKLLKGKFTTDGLLQGHRSILQQRIKDFSSHLIEYRGDQLRKLEENVKKLDDIQQKNNEIAAKNNELAALKKILSEKEAELAGLKKSFTEKENQTKKLSVKVQHIGNWLKEKDGLLSQKEEHLSSVLNSKSWKIMKFLRNMKNKLLKI